MNKNKIFNDTFIFFIIFFITLSFFSVELVPPTKKFDIHQIKKILYEQYNKSDYECYISNFKGTYCTGEPNSIGGIIIYYPFYKIFYYPYNFLVMSLINAIIFAVSVFLNYKISKSFVLSLLPFFLLPLIDFFFNFVGHTFTFLFISLSIYSYIRNNKKRFVLFLMPLALLRPEAIIFLLGMLIFDYCKTKRINAFYLISCFTFILLICTSQYISYKDPLAQLKYNINKEITEKNIKNFGVHRIILSFIFYLITLITTLLIVFYNTKKELSFMFMLMFTFYTFLFLIRSIAMFCCYYKIYIVILPFTIVAFKNYLKIKFKNNIKI
ncbi:MAG: hypothetical protein ACP5H9_02610 [Candidatus Woesearchaeota archaeon]